MDKSQMIRELINHFCNGNKAHFANMLGVKPQTINSWLTRDTFDTELIYSKCVDVSADWLLTGEGEMLKSNGQTESKTRASQRIIRPILKDKDKENQVITQRSAHDISVETRPRIPFDAAAGSLSIALGSVSESECEQIPLIPTLPRYDFTIFAKGDSMEPQYLSGDELACRLVSDSSFIQWGRPHVLDTAQGIVVKRIYENGSSITCKSNNPDYSDFDIPKKDIYHIALVVGSIRIE